METLVAKTGIAFLLFQASAAAACPPPPPPSPSSPVRDVVSEAREIVTRRFDNASNIVYGVIVDTPKNGGAARFRVLHVYAGSLKVGEKIDALAVDYHTIHRPVCPPPGPAFPKKGQYGVLAFHDSPPTIDFVDVCTLDYWFRNKWIRRASPSVPLTKNGIRCQVYDFRLLKDME